MGHRWHLPVTLKQLESFRYIIPEKEKVGGSGANFMVEWKTDKPVNPPIVESVMIGGKSGQGISFSSRGQVVFKQSKDDVCRTTALREAAKKTPRLLPGVQNTTHYNAKTQTCRYYY